jgi:hypothetical protein
MVGKFFRRFRCARNRSNLMNEYSEKELAMLRAVGVSDAVLNGLTPNRVYDLAVQKAFVNNLSGPAVESLRRCYIHLSAGCYRCTPEFENLIQL